jgi:hypothetical protein
MNVETETSRCCCLRLILSRLECLCFPSALDELTTTAVGGDFTSTMSKVVGLNGSALGFVAYVWGMASEVPAMAVVGRVVGRVAVARPPPPRRSEIDPLLAYATYLLACLR